MINPDVHFVQRMRKITRRAEKEIEKQKRIQLIQDTENIVPDILKKIEERAKQGYRFYQYSFDRTYHHPIDLVLLGDILSSKFGLAYVVESENDILTISWNEEKDES